MYNSIFNIIVISTSSALKLKSISNHVLVFKKIYKKYICNEN